MHMTLFSFGRKTGATAEKIHNRDNKSEESLEEQLIT